MVLALFGLAIVVGGLAFASFYTPYVWMPLAYVCILCAWLGTLPLIRERRAATPIALCLLVGVTLVWIRSEGLLSIGWKQVTNSSLLLAWWAGLLLSLVALVAVLRGKLGVRWGWLLTLLLMAGLVAQTSNAKAGAGMMVHWAMAHLHWNQAYAEEIVAIVRKTIHFMFYGLVGFTAWRAAGQMQAKRPEQFKFAIGAALILASFDELRQTTQMGRGGSLWDVLLDLAGASAALLVVGWATAKSPGPAPAKRAQ